MPKQLHFRLLLFLMVYLILKYMGGSFGALVLYPVTLLVTILHEFGHALGALLSGGSVEGLQINPDGSGYTITRGGSAGLVLVGGYLGSAILGNILFRIGAKHHRLAQGTLITMAVLMTLIGLIWFESFTSTGILWAFAASLVFFALKTNWDQDVLMFLGLAAVLYIIQDFNVGPSSDLAMYEKVVGFFPAQIWMYIWLAVAVLMSFWNARNTFRGYSS
ncbi:MAG TPA: M50 family metallopeptidase [Saprospiraceae bacterium]|nr:M50 family metallopeptidase [Saprospiraceae bacterium]